MITNFDELILNSNYWLNLNRLEKLNRGLERSVGDLDMCQALFDDAVAEVDRLINEEKHQHLSHSMPLASVAEKKKGTEWSQEELNLLIKAVNLFPAGTNQR